MNKLWFVIFGLTTIIVFIILFDKDPPSVDLAPYERAIAISDLKIKQLEEDSAKLAEKIKSDSLQQENEKITYQREAKKKDAVIVRLKTNPKVIEVLAANPETDSLVKALEEKNELQQVRIDTLESNLQALRVDMNKMNENFSARLSETEVKLKSTQALADAYKKDARKSKRAVKLWKVAAVVGSVSGLLIGIQN